jgi:putative sterol carrier protein
MTDTTMKFFERLTRRGHEPLLAKVTGTARFEVVRGERTDHWLLTIVKGDMSVSRDNAPADCTIRADADFLERMARGEANAMAAVLRGEVQCTGDVELLLAIQRLLPGPPAQQRSNASPTRPR